MRQAKLCDLSYIIKIIEDNGGKFEGLEFYLSTKVRNTFENTFLLSEDNNTLSIVERIGINKCQFHAYFASGVKVPLKETKSNFKGCLDILREITNYSAMITFVPKGKKNASVAARVIGFKLLGAVESKDCEEDIYIYNNIREVEECH